VRAAALLLLAAAFSAHAAESTLEKAIRFKWGTKTDIRFGEKPQEVERFQTIEIDVDRDLLTASASGDAELTGRIEYLKTAAMALAEAERVLLVELRGKVGELQAALQTGDQARIDAARRAIERSAADLAGALGPQLDRLIADAGKYPELSAELNQVILEENGYGLMADAIRRHIDQTTAALQQKLENQPEIALTATLVPPDDAQRALALRPYNDVEELAADAKPSFIPVVDDRTRRELTAAQGFRDVITDLGKVQDEARKTLDEFRSAVKQLQDKLQTDVLQRNLDMLVATLEQDANDTPALREARAARALVRTLAAPNLQLTGTTDADRLLFVANTLSQQADDLLAAVRDLPNALRRLAEAVRTQTVLAARQTVKDALKVIDDSTKAFIEQQAFFRGLVDNTRQLAAAFRRNRSMVNSAANLVAAARSIGETELDTELRLARIKGDLHVGDRIDVAAALYRRDPDTGERKAIEDETQTFVVERYGIFPDNIRGALLFVDPRSKIERDIAYQPVPAVGYFWKLGFREKRALNRALPAFGVSLSLLDFKDGDSLELGVAGSVSLFDLIWTGYGRNLQAKADYFFVGANPLAFSRFFRPDRR
jgi:hypothetical protein